MSGLASKSQLRKDKCWSRMLVVSWYRPPATWMMTHEGFEGVLCVAADTIFGLLFLTIATPPT